MALTPISTIAEVRTMGRIPAAVSDAVIQPHLSGAARELRSWLDEDYTTFSGDDREDCKEAEQCIAIAFALPVLHTFYTESIPTVQKEIGNMEFLFHGVEDMTALAETWMERARRRVRHLIEPDDTGSVGWYAI